MNYKPEGGGGDGKIVLKMTKNLGVSRVKNVG